MIETDCYYTCCEQCDGYGDDQDILCPRRCEVCAGTGMIRWATIMCAECGKEPVGSPRDLCLGCDAYRAHTGAI